MKKKLILLMFLLGFTGNMSGQNLWSGMKERQKDMPVGNTPAQVPERVPYRMIPTKMEKAGEEEWIISDGWVLSENRPIPGEANEKYNATVPGTVLTTLINQGVYPDPYYGLNNMAIPDSLSKKDWWYSVRFPIRLKERENQQYYLLFNGINYRSEIFLDGIKIGTTAGAFKRGCFNITELAQEPHEALLEVHVFPLDHPGIPHEQTMSQGQGLNGGATSLDGPTFIASVGWDWMPGIRDRNIGIWQDVRLLTKGPISIGDPLVVADIPLPDTTKAALHIETTVTNDHPYDAMKCQLLLKIRYNGIADGTVASESDTLVAAAELTFFLFPEETRKIVFSPENNPQLLVANPHLWWPNGYGEQNLYDLELTALELKSVPVNSERPTFALRNISVFSDSKHLRFGIREMSYELMAHDSVENKNVRICFDPVTRYTSHLSVTPVDPYEEVTPETPIPSLFDNESRILYSRERNVFIPSFASQDRSGVELLPQDDPVGPFLVIRVNGVRIFCRGGDWGMDDALKRSTRERLEPAFALHREMNFNIVRNWTGESTEEIFYTLCDEYGMLVWNDFWMTGDDTVGPEDFDLFLQNATDVVKRFRCHPSIAIWGPRNEGFAPRGLEVPISTMIAAQDPSRMYHGQSRYLNMVTSGPWNYFEDPSKYFTERAIGFNTEMGTFSIPTAATLRKFIPPADRWPINDVWAYHDLHHTSQNFTGFMKAVAEAGGLDADEGPWTLEEADSRMEKFADAAQSVCYDAWRAMLESWNSRMWNSTTGLILWMTHPAWPSMIWQTYSYDYEKTGAFWGAKKACEPIHVQMNIPEDEVVVVNVTRKRIDNLTVCASYFDNSGTLLHTQSTQILCEANALTRCFTPQIKCELPSRYLIRLELKDADGTIISQNEYRRTK